MKVTKILVGVALVVSVGLNVYLWQQAGRQRAEIEATRARATEAEALRAENEALKNQSTARPAATDAASLELARLRNEVGPLRKQAGEVESLRAQAAEASKLRAQVTAKQKELAEAESGLAEAAKITPEELLGLKHEAQAVGCINHMKQIGLAARLWAKEHDGVFPPDLAALKDQIPSVKVLFCNAAPGGVQAANWAEFDPKTMGYQFLNPNGSVNEPQKPLAFCPFHNNTVLSDASVYRDRRP